MELQAPPTQNFSIPEFNEFISIPLSHTAGNIAAWHIFSNDRQISNFITKQKIKSALELFDFIHFPSLVQFWSPTTCQQFLHSSDLPFALSALRKGICSFRKHCFNYRYSLHGDRCGPPARVFRRRFPEFCPDMRCYFEEEYELKEVAMNSGIRGYLCLPVFEPNWRFCIGVLEILTVMDASYCFRDVIGKVSDILKEVELRCSDVFWPFDTEQIKYNQLEKLQKLSKAGSSTYELAISEIQNALNVLCRKHKLPLAQTWIGGSSKDSFICRAKARSYTSKSTVISFESDCNWFHLGKGQGIVWEAFLSGSCFCRDITRLSISAYALVLGARKVELTSGFAICLQSTFTKNVVYILELFLPRNLSLNRQPWMFLTSLLDTMKQLFKTFKLSSGEEIGSDLPVVVLQISEDDPLEPFVICKNGHAGEGLRNQADKALQKPAKPLTVYTEANIAGSIVEMKENTASSSYVPKNEKMVLSHDAAINNRNELNPQNIMLAKNDATRTLSFGEAVSNKAIEMSWNNVKRTMPNTINPVSDINGGSSRKRSKVDSSSPKHVVESIQEPPSCCMNTPNDGHICLPSVLPASIPMQNQESIITVKADFKGDVIKFRVPALCGITKLKDEVTKRLNLNAATFDIICHCENNTSVLLDTDAKLFEYVRVAQSLGRSTVKLSIVVPQNDAVENAAKMILKASYKDDLIKFEFSFSAGMSELKKEMMKRLSLVDGSFEIKYTDENNLPVLLDGDAALQNCIRTVRLLQKSAMRVSIQPISNECKMIVKACHEDDIIKFELSSSSGMMKLKDEVRKRLKLEAGSFVVKYVDDDKNEVLVDGDAALNKYMKTMISLGRRTVKIFLQSVDQRA